MKIMDKNLMIKVLVLLGSHLAHIISIGMSISFGILYSEIRSEFQTPQSEAAWTASIFNGLLGLSGIPLCILVPRIGERWATLIGTVLLCSGMVTSSFVTRYNILYITYGLTAGLGASIIHYCANIVLVSQFNSKWRPLAITLANSGASVSALVMPPFMVASIEAYSWRTTFIVLGCVSAFGLFSAATFVKPKGNRFASANTSGQEKVRTSEDKDTRESNEGDNDDRSLKRTFTLVIHNVDFMIFFTSSVMTFMVVFGPATFLPDLMHESLIEEKQVSWCIVGMGFGNLFGRIIGGIVASRLTSHVQLIHGLALLGYGIVTLVTTFALNLPTFMVMSVLLGLFTGGYFGLHMAVVAHYLTLEQVAVGFGMTSTAGGVSSTAGMPLAGFITDYFKSERGSFIFCGCVMILAALVLCLIKVKRYFVNTYNVTDTERTNCDKNEDFEIISTYI